MLDLCLLGTGGMMPLPNRWLASLLIRYNGKMVLIDCGEGTQISLKNSGWGFKAIDAIYFTHYHADHIAGLPGLLLTIGNAGRLEPLTLMGPPGINEVISGLTVISPQLPYDLRLVEFSDHEPSGTCINDIVISSIPVDHTLTCLAYSIEIKRKGKFDVERAKKHNIPVKYWNTLQKGEILTFDDRIINPEMVLGEPRLGLKVCYCTDTRPTGDLIEFIKGSDIFICEGMYGEDDKFQKAFEKKHMLFSEAANLALKGNVKEMWLTHYSPSIPNPEEYLDNATKIFQNTFAGKDLMVRALNFKD